MAPGTTLEKLNTFKPEQAFAETKAQPWKTIWPPNTDTPTKPEAPQYPATNKLPNMQAAFGYNEAHGQVAKSDKAPATGR